MNKKTILITMKTSMVNKNLHHFDKNKYNLIICDNTVHSLRDDMKLKIKNADGILWHTYCGFKLDKEILKHAGNNLKIVSTISAGYDSIDTTELKNRNIKLGNVSPALSGTVATLAVGLAIAAARRFQEGRNLIANGLWNDYHNDDDSFLGNDLEESTIGIVGFGGIGQMIAKRLLAFDIGRILYSGNSIKHEASSLNAEFVTFDDLLKESDFIFICCPLNDNTRHLFNKETFIKMKTSSILINISRGNVIDQDALVEALKTNQITAAGLDVMTPEPLPKDHPLVNLPNCILMPHVGSATTNTRMRMCQTAIKNITNYFEEKPMIAEVQL